METPTAIHEAPALDKINRFAEMLKTISHPVRLQIITALDKHTELNVQDLISEIDTPLEQSLISHHLIKMKDRGILSSDKRGAHVYYKLENRGALSVLACINNCNC